MVEWLKDDKNLVILAVTVIALAFGYGNPNILDNIISGLFGLAVGRATNQGR